MGLINMHSKKDEKFFLASYEMISHMVQFCESAANDIEIVSLSDYADKFSNLTKSFEIAREKIKGFIDQWEDDEEKVCSTLRSVNEYFKYYTVSMKEATPSTYRSSSRYIKDSLMTAKLALKSKLNYITANGK